MTLMAFPLQIGVLKKNPSLYAKLDKYLNSSWLTESIINILQYGIEIVLLRKKLEVVSVTVALSVTSCIFKAIKREYVY